MTATLEKFPMFRDRLWFGDDPYQGVAAGPVPDAMRGWDQRSKVLEDEIKRVKPRSILEVGSYCGASAIWMAECARLVDPYAEVLCVDPWERHAAYWFDPPWRKACRGAFDDFRSNVAAYGLTDVITYLPLTSVEAARVAEKTGLAFDLAYIDGAHDYEHALEDLELWSPRVRKSIVVDDYVKGFMGVVDAVNDFAAAHSFELTVKGRKAVLRR